MQSDEYGQHESDLEISTMMLGVSRWKSALCGAPLQLATLDAVIGEIGCRDYKDTFSCKDE